MKQLRAGIPRTDVALATKRTNGYCVLIQDRQVVAEATVHVADAMKSWR